MPTLTPSVILQQNIEAFKVHVPFMFQSGVDFSGQPLKLDQLYTAHIDVLPSAADYDANNGGYENGATEGRSLMVDLPILIDRHKHVPLKASHLWSIKDQKQRLDRALGNAGFVLGKTMADSVYGKVKGSTFSRKITESAGNADLDTLENINSMLNESGAAPGGRIGIVNTNVAQSIGLDARVASAEYYGQKTGGQSYRVYRNIAGFQAIYEYPTLSNNNGSGKTFTAATNDVITSAGHGFLNGDRVRVTTSAADLPAGLTVDTDYYVRDATTDTFKVSLTDGGAAVDITDAGTGTHTVTGYENLSGFFFEPSAVAVAAGIPDDSDEIASAFGIPKTMGLDRVTDPDTGFSLALMKWQKGGTSDLYLSPASIWGSALGRQGGAANSLTDPAGVRLVFA